MDKPREKLIEFNNGGYRDVIVELEKTFRSFCKEDDYEKFPPKFALLHGVITGLTRGQGIRDVSVIMHLATAVIDEGKVEISSEWFYQFGDAVQHWCDLSEEIKLEKVNMEQESKGFSGRVR